ncbi:hypothetical protein ACOMHN_061096 [Nucella lapillus]
MVHSPQAEHFFPQFTVSCSCADAVYVFGSAADLREVGQLVTVPAPFPLCRARVAAAPTSTLSTLLLSSVQRTDDRLVSDVFFLSSPKVTSHSQVFDFKTA